uniref:Uncharacterized protein n=1 Tax=Ciona intestinalis TaxID=7719 RepID=H2Y0V8_CIOIN
MLLLVCGPFTSNANGSSTHLQRCLHIDAEIREIIFCYLRVRTTDLFIYPSHPKIWLIIA